MTRCRQAAASAARRPNRCAPRGARPPARRRRRTGRGGGRSAAAVPPRGRAATPSRRRPPGSAAGRVRPACPPGDRSDRGPSAVGARVRSVPTASPDTAAVGQRTAWATDVPRPGDDGPLAHHRSLLGRTSTSAAARTAIWSASTLTGCETSRGGAGRRRPPRATAPRDTSGTDCTTPNSWVGRKSAPKRVVADPAAGVGASAVGESPAHGDVDVAEGRVGVDLDQRPSRPPGRSARCCTKSSVPTCRAWLERVLHGVEQLRAGGLRWPPRRGGPPRSRSPAGRPRDSPGGPAATAVASATPPTLRASRR